MVERLTTDLEAFIDYCNTTGVEGTLLIETRVIEFHWTFGFELEKENQKIENSNLLEEQFRKLSERFVAVREELRIECKAS